MVIIYKSISTKHELWHILRNIEKLDENYVKFQFCIPSKFHDNDEPLHCSENYVNMNFTRKLI